MKYAKYPKGSVLLDVLGLNRCSSNRFETPSPDPRLAFRCVSRGGLGVFIFLRSISMQSKGKLIWSLAEAKLKTMRAAALTHSLAFSWGSLKAESLEDSEGDTCMYVYQALSHQPRKGAQKSVRGSHTFPLLTAVPKQFWVTCGVKMMSLRHGWG